MSIEHAVKTNYKTVDEEDVRYLRNLLGNDRVLAGDEINEDFSHDELAGITRYPEVLVYPVTTEEVSAVMRYASEKGIAVTPRGQGTGLVGGSVCVRGGIMLNLSKMNRILDLDEENLTITVEPGVLLMEITKYVEAKDLFYPPDPGEKSASIGGNINTNAGGMRAVKYGVTRDYVRGLTVVLPDGRVVKAGGKVVKNSSGYSLKDLVVGSEGTLGIVTEAVLRLLPLPKKFVSLLVPFPDLPSAIRTVPKIIQSKAIPTAIEFMEREIIVAAETYLGKAFPDNSADAYLLLTFDGNSQEEVRGLYEKVAELCLAEGALDVYISDTQERQESLWSARGAFLEGTKACTTEIDECDVVVPRNRVADFILYTRELQDEFGVRIRSFGHAGDGNLHIYTLKDELSDDRWVELRDRIFDRLYERARELGGLVSGEHGIGWAKTPYFAKSMDDAGLDLIRGIKRAFDPQGILNPGKILGDT